MLSITDAAPSPIQSEDSIGILGVRVDGTATHLQTESKRDGLVLDLVHGIRTVNRRTQGAAWL